MIPWCHEAAMEGLHDIQLEDSFTVMSSTLARMVGRLGSPETVTHVAWLTQESWTPCMAAQGSMAAWLCMT